MRARERLGRGILSLRLVAEDASGHAKRAGQQASEELLEGFGLADRLALDHGSPGLNDGSVSLYVPSWSVRSPEPSAGATTILVGANVSPPPPTG